MKRFLSSSINCIKKRKINNFPKRKLVTNVSNFQKATSKVNQVFSESSSVFSNYLLQQGVNFEKMIIDSIKVNFPVQYISDKINLETLSLTRKFIEQKIPILHSVPIINEQNQTKGIIDLLVRNDYIDKLFENPPPQEKTDFLYYIVIDIKFSSLKLKSDNIHILNSKKLRAYKYQLHIYNQAIGLLQDYTPRYSYLIGRRVINSSSIFIDSFKQVGVVDFQNKDEFIKTYYDNEDTSNNNITNQQQTNIREIWNCTEKHEKLAISNNIFSWQNPNFSSKIINENGNKGKIIDAIVNTNRQNEFKILPTKINNNIFHWKQETQSEAFIDFECFCDVFEMNQFTNQIFMIGVWYQNQYYNFTANSTQDEVYLCESLLFFLKVNKITKLWYYYADKMIWNKALKRTNITDSTVIEWCDLLTLFKNPDEPITIKNCFRFGLKEIANCLYNHKLIQTKLESDCQSGLDAGLNSYIELAKPFDQRNHKIIQDVAKYNEFDVKVLSEILTYLRKNHTSS